MTASHARKLTPLLFLALSLALAPAARAFTEVKLPLPEIEKLPNGLEVVWFVNDHLPVIDLSLLVKSGYRDDPAGKSGTAELVAAALDRGDAGMTAQEIGHAVESLGASRYTNADDDSFSVGVHGLAPDADALLDLLAKMALHPDFPKEEVKRQQDRMLDRWSHVGDYGETLVSLAFQRILKAHSTYGRGSLASVAEFKKVTRDDVVAFHRKHFTPKNAILMVVGRVKKDEFRKRLLADFGDWKGEAPSRAYVTYSDPRLAAPKGEIILVNRPDLTQAQVRFGMRAPSIHSPERYSLVVANALLGEYFNSRLNSLIRDKLALTYSIGSAFSYSKDLGVFSIASATRNEETGLMIRKTMEVLQNLKKGPIPAAEVKMAKNYLEGGFPLGTSTLGAVASRWLAGYFFNMGPGYLNEFVPKVEAVTPSEVLAAVRKDFNLDHMVIVIAGDANAIQKSLTASNFKRVKRVQLRDLM